jgi:hypothetical protein
VDEPPDRLGVDTEFAGHIPDADQIARISPYGRHNLPEVCQVLRLPVGRASLGNGPKGAQPSAQRA